MSNETVIVELKLFDRGQLKAFADVTIALPVGEITVRGFRVVQKDSQTVAWIAFPAVSYSKNGKIINKEILEVSRGLKKQITDAIFTEFKRVTENSK